MAEIEATSTSMADVENPFKLSHQGVFVVKLICLPGDGVTRRRLKAAFALVSWCGHSRRKRPASRDAKPARSQSVVECVERFLEAVCV